jgi:hypothetical protein
MRLAGEPAVSAGDVAVMVSPRAKQPKAPSGHSTSEKCEPLRLDEKLFVFSRGFYTSPI